MRRISMGLPLALALAGTVGSLAFGAKKVHIAFGIALTGLSLLHAYQHRQVMVRSLPCYRPVCLPACQTAVPQKKEE